MARLTLVAGLLFFAPIDLAALHFGWGLGGVWAGLLAFYVVRLVGMVARTRSSHWTVVGASQ
jgi:Na+-driven multidrug efflux pump